MIKFSEATEEELEAIIALLKDDVLGKDREEDSGTTYKRAFDAICADPNHGIIVGRDGGTVVSCLQLSILPCLTHGGRKRAQIEGVRVSSTQRGKGIGRKMIEWAINRATKKGCGVVQLTTDRQRPEALHFYEGLGFANTHCGLKLNIQRAEA